MDFLFHSVFNDGQHSKYFNVYKIEQNRFLAECHHFNRARNCEGDFELVREGETWKATNDKFEEEATYIGEELERAGKV
jgi:hypothetical protein